MRIYRFTLLALTILGTTTRAVADESGARHAEPRYELRARAGMGMGGNMAAILAGADAMARIASNVWAGVSWTEVVRSWDAAGGDKCPGECWYHGRWVQARAEGHLLPRGTFDPWIGAGVGILQASPEYSGDGSSLFAGLSGQAGLDVRIGHFVVGPTLGIAGPLGKTGGEAAARIGKDDSPIPWIVTGEIRLGASF